ncbi:MAG: hypothetical protein H6686_04860 [Fibrobacteria bacterium]|nr:hypothetical protein [Fibrobacteria bacterium]
MKLAPLFVAALLVGAVHATPLVPEITTATPATSEGTSVTGGTILVKAKSTASTTTIRVDGAPTIELSSIRLDRDLLLSPPGNLVREAMEVANNENR